MKPILNVFSMLLHALRTTSHDVAPPAVHSTGTLAEVNVANLGSHTRRHITRPRQTTSSDCFFVDNRLLDFKCCDSFSILWADPTPAGWGAGPPFWLLMSSAA